MKFFQKDKWTIHLRARKSKMAAKIAFREFRRLFRVKTLFPVQREIPDNVVNLRIKREISASSLRLFPMVPIVIEQTVSFIKAFISLHIWYFFVLCWAKFTVFAKDKNLDWRFDVSLIYSRPNLRPLPSEGSLHFNFGILYFLKSCLNK